IDSVSKSGTSRYSGQLSYQFQTDNMAEGIKKSTSLSRFQKNLYWTELNGGGPIVKDHLFFFGSYYPPQQSRDHRRKAYGELPDFESTRNEGFGKVTARFTNTILGNFSYRDSKRDDTSSLFGQFTAPTAGSGNESRQKIGTADGSWIINQKNYVSF